MYKTRLRMNSIQKKQQVLNITHDIWGGDGGYTV